MRKIYVSAAMLLLMGSAAMAQQPSRVIRGNDGLYPEFIEYSPTDAPRFTKGQVLLSSETSTLGTSTSLRLSSRETDKLGMEHYRYQQVMNGFPVEYATYIVHVQGGKVISENGTWVKEEIANSLATTPGISEDYALKLALSKIGASVYKWQVPEEEALLKQETGNPNATYFPDGTLVYYSGEQQVAPSSLKLAYRFDVYAQYPISRQIIYIDAATGIVMGSNNLIRTVDAPGTAVTAYSGTQAITTDNTGTTFRLREASRGLGIQTFDMRLASTNYAAAVDFTDADNNWNNVNTNKDQYATDAHWGAEKTYDYYFTKYGRNSIDNAGFLLKNYVHVNLIAFGYGNNINAFWDGLRMSYGDGGVSGTTTYTPLTALDVAGHEITHGVTEKTSNLTYSGESGAMNEGFSDIFGTSIEFFGKTTGANWLIGENIGAAFRNMSNPNQFSQPDTYKGTFWYTGTADNGGVHTNSGVLNFWYYLLSQGGSGTNDNGTAYSVTGIGIDKAGAIAYRTNTTYLIASSNYSSARTYSIKSAEDLYGVGSVEATQTANAWDAVGVGAAAPPPPVCTDNYESNNTRATAKVIPLNTDITATIGSSTDKDYFTFTTTTAAPKLKVTLTNLPADYDIRLYNSAGTQLAISQNAGTTAETIIRNTATTGATYYVQVYGFSGANSTTCYTLRASTGSINFFDAPGVEGISAKDLTDVRFGVYPNPARNAVTVRFTSSNTGTKEITINDLMGRVVYRQVVPAQAGANTVNITLPELSKGVYLLRVDKQQFTKLTLVR